MQNSSSGFIKKFQRGKYEAACEYCMDGSFYEVLNNSKVYDTDGVEIIWKKNVKLWSEEILRFSIETYVRPYLRRVEFTHLSTQRLDDGATAVVHFLFDYTIHDLMGPGANLIAPNVYRGYVEGDCYLKRSSDGSMVIERFELTIFNVEGMDLKRYLHDI